MFIALKAAVEQSLLIRYNNSTALFHWADGLCRDVWQQWVSYVHHRHCVNALQHRADEFLRFTLVRSYLRRYRDGVVCRKIGRGAVRRLLATIEVRLRRRYLSRWVACCNRQQYLSAALAAAAERRHRRLRHRCLLAWRGRGAVLSIEVGDVWYGNCDGELEEKATGKTIGGRRMLRSMAKAMTRKGDIPSATIESVGTQLTAGRLVRVAVRQGFYSFHSDVVDAAGGGLHSYRHRIVWLLGLLLLQSLSSFVLSSYSTLLTTHPVIVYFLTMLVGAGGNAGSQSAVLVVRRIALGLQGTSSIVKSVAREVGIALGMAALLGVASAVRTLVIPVNDGEQVTWIESIAISFSMVIIVLTSVLLGTLLPLLLQRFGCDPAHAGAAIQVSQK
ncbi:hypothetical protein FOZ63_020297 [Perkinsus olseni]|uniref:SLC41A/MgtE integral membrane domain-containing protein n=1 Tax=Perkinsus olseni TaxID=32597 RepID=A0A7J6U8A3_PEROL|nr:hypothetical protein FOZ63_020297 [Perkinsus olseni]